MQMLQNGRHDAICSGSLMGINYKEIESNSVGNKEDYEMYSLECISAQAG